uniref:transmembrane protein 56-like isoform X1 n=1 Tax=Ciona intestinalis TaxID=7719 RepID=UPI000180CA50|nr:transmembrane protein 56-like isoform X1 [Ciona intestinalis]|eukprot:XP_002126003.1 transmembrane protein 56-like isoform X1 [Ciona intestinalis]
MASRYVISNVLVMVLSSFCFHFMVPWFSRKLTSHFKSYQKLPSKLQTEWHNRNVSTVHSTIVTVLSIYVALTDTDGYRNAIWAESQTAEMVLSILLGYIYSDIVYLLQSSPSQTDAYWGSMLHHIIVVIVYSCCTFWGCYTHLTIVRTIAEVSTPFVNMRWILDACRMKDSKVFMYNGILMTLTFFGGRILLMPYAYVRLYQLRNTKDFQKLGKVAYTILLGIFVDGLNIYWFARIMKGLIKYIKINTAGKD